MVSLKVYLSLEKLTRPLVAMVVEFCMSGWRSRPVRGRVVLRGLQKHCGKTYDWPTMSHPHYVLNGYFVGYQEHSEYVGLSNIERWFHDKPAFKKNYKT